MLSNISDSSGILAQYDYLGDGTIVKVTHPQVYLGLKLTVTLDQFGRVATQDWTVGADDILIDGYVYAYDATGNRTAKTNSMNSAYSEGYTYDGLDRLIDTTRGPSNTDYQNWTLDQLGNWTGFDDNGTPQTRTADAANQIQSIDSQDTTGWYDANGNMIFDGTYNYTYDAWNRLVQVTQTVDETTTTIATYAYDGNNYRVSKTVGATTTDYYYNTSWQVVEEQQGGTMTAQYVWDIRYIDTPICRFTPQTGGGTQALYYTTDANNNVTALVNSYGSVVERYVYDSYGKVTVLHGAFGADPEVDNVNVFEWNVRTAGSAYGNEILYCGYRYNPETGNYSDRFRDYEAPLGVWMQRDPIRSGANLYEYVNDSPVESRDPSGLLGGPGQAYWPNWKSRYTRSSNASCCVCGPDVTDWFLKDLKLQSDYMKKEYAAIDKATAEPEPGSAASWATTPFPGDPDDPTGAIRGAFHTAALAGAAGILKLKAFKNDVKYLLDYKWMSFDMPGTGTGKCYNTVEISGLCVRRNQLGNIAFGYISWLYAPLPFTGDPTVSIAGSTYGYAYSDPMISTYGAAVENRANINSWDLGLKRRDNLAAWSVGIALGKSGSLTDASLRASLGSVGALQSLYPGSILITSSDLTHIPEYGGYGFDTATCCLSGMTWPVNSQSSIDFAAALRKTYDTQNHGVTDYDRWLRYWYENYWNPALPPPQK